MNMRKQAWPGGLTRRIHLSRVKGVRRERMLQHDPYAGFDESVRVLNEQLNLLLR